MNYNRSIKVKRDNTLEREKVISEILRVVVLVAFLYVLYCFSWDLARQGLL